ncbi:MAG: cyclic nucleotide-binding domain-containing protein [Bradyrhizobium sp.]
MSIEDDISFIERVPTLQMLGRTALRILAIGAESRYVHQGEVLFEAGEVTDCGYVIQEGTFSLDSGSRSIGEVVVGPGTLLGELALIAETKRPATATAREPSTVIRLSRSLFLKMLEGYPDAAHMLRQQLAARAQHALNAMHDIRALLDTSDAAPR